MHGGAADYVPKPIDLEELETAVERALTVCTDDAADGLVVDPNGSGDRKETLKPAPGDARAAGASAITAFAVPSLENSTTSVSPVRVTMSSNSNGRPPVTGD